MNKFLDDEIVKKYIKIKLKMIPLVTFMTWEKLKIMLIT